MGTLEFTIIAPVIMLILCAGLQLGMWYLAQEAALTAARKAATAGAAYQASPPAGPRRSPSPPKCRSSAGTWGVMAMRMLRRVHWRDDRGTYTLETVICVTFLLPFLGLLAAYGLAGVFDSSVDNAANSAARAASQAADADTAQVRGRAAASAALRQDDRNCTSRTVSIDTSSFNAPLGQAASVTATVTCTSLAVGTDQRRAGRVQAVLVRLEGGNGERRAGADVP
ncbi:TadE family protein [Streptomyces sioyaensis]|uniref:TadE family protein n=1 Tax=Streptomyces sioyaensis TaxID=67364 RepID=UPI0033E88E3C